MLLVDGVVRGELWQVIEDYQQAKRRAGSLDFQDLLICARDLLRHPAARRDLQARYDCIFIDEFQDTDPLQAEILLALSAEGAPGSPAGRSSVSDATASCATC